jgi:deoxycytidylate deaminase
LNCLYEVIKPGIEKITAPNRYQYHAATSAVGKKYLSIKARKNPTPALQLRVD